MKAIKCDGCEKIVLDDKTQNEMYLTIDAAISGKPIHGVELCWPCASKFYYPMLEALSSEKESLKRMSKFDIEAFANKINPEGGE